MKLRHSCLLFLSLLVLPLLAVSAYADSAVLGSNQTTAVLGASGVTNTGATTVTGGDVLSYPNTSATAITGASSITITGGTIGFGTATNQSDLVTAISDLASLPSLSLSTAGLSGDVTLTPGVYSSPSSFLVNGVLTLNAEGESNVDFIFVLGSAGTAGSLTASGNVVLENNTGTNVGVYWVLPDGSASLDGTAFVGNVLASTSITMTAGEDITCGSALANTGDVAMINDTITTGCNGGAYISSTTGGVVTTSGGTTSPSAGTPPVLTPEPGTFGLLSVGLGLVLLTYRRKLSAAKGGVAAAA